MSSQSGPSSASSNSPTTPAICPPERTATASGYRTHASSASRNVSDVGPASDRRAERRRSTISGPDRKRRLANTHGDVWLRRAGPGTGLEPGPSRSTTNVNSWSIPSGSSRTRTEHATLGTSYATPIDLSSPSPNPVPPNTSDRRSSWSRTGGGFLEYIRPRWQPDTEVTECPICGTPFSFWYRKHHCRKCGRVVCASCSPHRITIPRQFIVRPPEPYRSPVPTLVAPGGSHFDLEASDISTAFNPALGGGEEVRLCNPCVPDPNPEPPPGYTALRSCTGAGSVNQSRHRSYHSMSTPSRAYPYSVTADNASSRPSRRTLGSNEFLTFAGLGGSFASQIPERPIEYGPISARFAPALRASTSLPHTGQSARPLPPGTLHSTATANLADNWRSSHSLRRRIDERDLCPICDNELPPLGENGNEDVREVHIRECIESHGRQTGSLPQSGSPVTQPAIPVRMLIFTATEKDCLGHDGATQECTICMEDYEVGQSLVRLECLCKFHKRCIVEWFERKKECPVHKVS